MIVSHRMEVFVEDTVVPVVSCLGAGDDDVIDDGDNDNGDGDGDDDGVDDGDDDGDA